VDRCRRVDGLADGRCCSDDVRRLRTLRVWLITSRSKADRRLMAPLSAARCDRLAPPCGLVRGRPGSDVDRDLSARRLARPNAADPNSRDVIRKAEAVPKRRLRPQGMAEAQSKAELDLRGFEALLGELADQESRAGPGKAVLLLGPRRPLCCLRGKDRPVPGCGPGHRLPRSSLRPFLWSASRIEAAPSWR